MKNKEIVFTKPNTAEFLDCDIPKINENEVLVKLCVSTISSGTERANLIGDVNISIADNIKKAEFPRRSGYSSSGVVEQIGLNVRDLKVGDKVALSWSTHRRYVSINEKNVHKIINNDISFEESALWHISTFPAAAVRKCRLEFGESALVMGMGVLGMIAVRILRAAGAVPIIAVDPSAEKRKLAEKIGADYAFSPDECAKKVKEIAEGGVNIAIEVTGKGEGLDNALDCMKKFGRIALLGCTRDSDFSIDYYRKVHGPGISLIGAHTLARPEYESFYGWWTERDDIMTIQKLVELKRLKFEDLIEETHSPENAPVVYRRLVEEKTFPIVQFDWRRV